MIYKLHDTYKSLAENKALKKLVYLDTLTGLYNRRGLDKNIKHITSLDISFSLYSFDLNSLKFINDKYGHRIGDEAIKRFGKHLSRIYNDGLCCRIGGDEFIVIIKDTPFNITLMEKLKHHISQENMSKKYEYSLNFSFGKANFIGSELKDIHDILNQADKEMYKMKKNQKIIN